MQEKIQKVSPIKQNILHFIETLNISKREFYQLTGVSRGTLESNTGITEETLTKIFATYNKLNIEWVFFSKGDMIKGIKPKESNENCQNCQEKEERIQELKETIAILKDHIALMKEVKNEDAADASVADVG
ncbi:MAG: hypothetical protein PHI36_09975 [Bacteroidales bacterium]|nr:hypothetical protein [Bacteroidales bacterium]